MFKAILIRHYDNNQTKKRILCEALDSLMKSEANEYRKQWVDLFLFRSQDRN